MDSVPASESVGLYRLDSRVKVPLALGVIVAVAALPSAAFAAYILLISALWAAALTSRVPLGWLIRRGWLAVPFGIAALPLLFTTPGSPLWAILPGSGLTLTDSGLLRFGGVMLKAWISLQGAALLTRTTPFPEILIALRALKVPRLLVATIALMGRYLFIFSETARQMLQARQARSSQPDPRRRAGGTLFWRAKVTGGMAASLLLRAFERGERVYAAMLGRGYDGEMRSLPRPALPAAAYRVLAGGLLFLFLTVGFGWLTAGGRP